MTYDLLVKKLDMMEKRYLSGEEIRVYCEIIGLDYYAAIGYLTRHRHVYRILKGIFYKPNIGERKLKKIEVNHLDAVAEALKMKKVKNWYLGMESAIRMNHATHEFFTTDTIINDAIFRKNPMMILGNKVRFIKVKSSLTKTGIKKNGKLRYASLEKTVLDMVYLSKYRGKTDAEIKNSIIPLLDHCSMETLRRYAKTYTVSTERFIASL
jgi:hypothetical protein